MREPQAPDPHAAKAAPLRQLVLPVGTQCPPGGKPAATMATQTIMGISVTPRCSRSHEATKRTLLVLRRLLLTRAVRNHQVGNAR